MSVAVGELRAALATVADVDRTGWAGAARSAELVELLGVQERLAGVILQVAGAWDADQAWAADGARSPVAWIAHRAPLTRQDASTLVRTARHVHAHEKTAKALDGGDITAAHATIAAQAAKHRADLYREHEDVILDVAREVAPAAFRQLMQYWRACADDARPDPPGDDANYLDVTPTFDGIGHLEGRLDPVSTKALTDCLDRLEPPDPTDGPRPPRPLAQRRAAALMRLVTGDRAPRARIDIIIDVETFAGRRSLDPRAGCCEIVGQGPVSTTLAQTLACDAAIGRVVMRGRSEVLDLGRRTHLVTPALRRSLAARDRTCVEPGCDIPAHWCDAHHITPWQRHGPTTLSNLELRCRRHHLQVHRAMAREAARQRE